MSSPTPPVVAVLNTNDDTVELLRVYLESEGYVVISAHLQDLKRGEVSLDDYVAEHDPKVVVFDLAPPYDRSWLFLQHVRNQPSMKGRPFVLTSTNPRRVVEIAQASNEEPIHEIIGKPYDLQEIVSAVKSAVGRS
jgi:response regulator RpfG family c-di-GMP phosphodiesterase